MWRPLSFPDDIIQEDVEKHATAARKRVVFGWKLLFVCFNAALNVRPSKTNQAAATTCVILGRGGAGDGGGGVCVYYKSPQLRLSPPDASRKSWRLLRHPEVRRREEFFLKLILPGLCVIFLHFKQLGCDSKISLLWKLIFLRLTSFVFSHLIRHIFNLTQCFQRQRKGEYIFF